MLKAKAFYYLLVVPLGFIYRIYSKDAKALKVDKKKKSYWTKSRAYSDMRSQS